MGFLLILSGYCCSLGEYSSPTLRQCLPCESGCEVCTSSSTCLACSSGYYLSSSNCYSCQTSCSACLNMATCTGCSNGFYLNSSSTTCQLCATNCLQCDSYSCKKCNSGFYPNGKDCHSCEVSCECSSGTLQDCPAITSSMLIVTIVVPIVGTSLIVLICSICYRKLHQKQ
jgi:proprotein convertase subtilisin/kexin type 5